MTLSRQKPKPLAAPYSAPKLERLDEDSISSILSSLFEELRSQQEQIKALGEQVEDLYLAVEELGDMR